VKMTEEYLLAWNDHHSTFFSAMTELVSGDVLTDVNIWAGQTLYSAHKLVLALSSAYFRTVLTGAAANEGRMPVIFLKDVTSKDLERLLWYMYRGEVSVPQTELLSLISAAKSLGIRGLAEENVNHTDITDGDKDNEVKDLRSKDVERRGVKRESDDNSINDMNNIELLNKKLKHSFPKLQHKLANKIWNRSEPISRDNQHDSQPASKKMHSKNVTALRPHNENIQKGADTNAHTRAQVDSEAKEDKSGDLEMDADKRDVGPVGGFLEVTVKQEEEDCTNEDSNNITAESTDEFINPPISLVRRSLLPALVQNNASTLAERRPGSSTLISHSNSATTPASSGITRSTGTCHFCGRSFMKNKQLMNHVCPMRPTGK